MDSSPAAPGARSGTNFVDNNKRTSKGNDEDATEDEEEDEEEEHKDAELEDDFVPFESSSDEEAADLDNTTQSTQEVSDSGQQKKQPSIPDAAIGSPQSDPKEP